MNQRDEVTDELISAYLDGELSADERARVEQLLAASEQHQQTLEDMRSLAVGMQTLPTYQLGRQFADRVLDVARQADPSLAIGKQVAASDSSRRTPALPGSLRQRALRHWRVGIPVALAVAVTLLIAFWLGDATDDSGQGASNSSSVAVLPKNAPQKRAQRQSPPAADAIGDDPLAKATAKATASPSPAPQMSRNEQKTGVERLQPRTLAADASTERPSDVQAEPSEQPGARLNARQMVSQTPPTPAPASKPKITVGPGWSSQKMLLVIDVQLTRAGWEKGQFERLLGEAGVAFDANIKVEAELEKTLLDSRFFEPADARQPQQDEQETPFTIVYVVTRGGAIDQVWQQMQQDPSDFARVSLDMALQPADTTVFRQLQRLGELATPQAQVAGGAQRNIAHRLQLSPAWNGRPIDRPSGAAAGTLSSDPGSRNLAPPPANRRKSPLDPLSLPGEMFGGNVYSEVIFVLRGDVPQSD